MDHIVGLTRAGLLSSVVALCLITIGCSTDDRMRRKATSVERIKADSRAHSMIQQLGGISAWKELEVITFDFVVHAGVEVLRRSHVWDKRRGLHRWTEGDITAYTDLWSGKGKVFRTEDGQPSKIEDADDKAAILDEAYRAFINDTWWLAAPFKVFDEGVHRAVMDGDIRLTFDAGVGLTSGDAYLFHLDDDANLTGWSFDLESGWSASFMRAERQTVHGVTFHTHHHGPLGFGVRIDQLQGRQSPAPDIFGPLSSLRPELFQ